MRSSGVVVRGRGGLCVLVASIVMACGGSSSPTALAGYDDLELEAQSADAVNATRQSEGLKPLRSEREDLLEVAREHSRAMQRGGFVGHVGPDGRDLEARLRDAGIDFTLAGENIARVTNAVDPAGAAHQRFMQSGPHRSNILQPSYETFAVGVVQKDGTSWFTQIFVCP